MALGEKVTLLLNAAGTGDFGAAEAGTAVEMSKSPWLARKKVQFHVGGTFVGTVKIQSSPDNSTWTDLVIGANGTATTTTTPLVGEITLDKYMRANCTAWTSGAPSVRLIASV